MYREKHDQLWFVLLLMLCEFLKHVHSNCV